MNWLMGLGLVFNALGNIISGSRRGNIFPSFGLPVFSYPMYPPVYQYYQPYRQPQYSPSQTTYNQNEDFLVGNTLAGISTTAESYSGYTSKSSIFNMTQPQSTSLPDDYNLVGNTLLSIQPSSYNDTGTSQILGLSGITPLRHSQTQSYQSSNLHNNDIPPTHIGSNATIRKNGDYVKISRDIENRIKQIAAKLNCDYKDLEGVIWAESRFNPKAWNGTTAIGLIQFTQICIDDLNQVYGLNLTKQKIERMDVFQQLDLAEKSLLRAKQIAGLPQSHRLNAGELYTINFLPGRLKDSKTKGYLTKRGEDFYTQNKGADVNKDGYITKAELNSFVQKGRKYVSVIA